MHPTDLTTAVYLKDIQVNGDLILRDIHLTVLPPDQPPPVPLQRPTRPDYFTGRTDDLAWPTATSSSSWTAAKPAPTWPRSPGRMTLWSATS